MSRYLVTKINSKVENVIVESKNETAAIEDAINLDQWKSDDIASTLRTNYIITKI